MPDVFCKKYQKLLPALSIPPFPGEAGKQLMQTTSAQAWQDWMQHQTRLINEKHLNMMDEQSRKYLAQQRDLFLSGDDFDSADGFVAPTNP